MHIRVGTNGSKFERTQPCEEPSALTRHLEELSASEEAALSAVS